MPVAAIASLLAFLSAAAAGLLAFLAWGWPWGAAAFLALGLAGALVAGTIFRRLASPEERRAELEDRVRNPP